MQTMKRESELLSADDMAKAMWQGYMTTADPAKRRWYAFRYEFWKGLSEWCDCMGNPHIECSKSDEWHKAHPL